MQAPRVESGDGATLADGFDVIQARYGWTDDVILSMPYARFREVLSTASKAHAREVREQYAQAAFVGWQFYTVMGGKDAKLTFGKWLSIFKLSDPKKVDRIADESRARMNAASVMEAFR